ncbi:MAG TPA: hypothetical protein VFQ91_22370 [Bryobacteraceae bacterium]|nr:hypothetical protein [Bryobacteraceae bacterium]
MSDKRRFTYLLPAVAMMLGWGLRGFIGGGPFGAMIPGAMVALSLCFLWPRKDVTMLAAFTAIGVGIGGEMTYGQTVGFSVHAETFWWGILGLALKGGVWGALAGAIIALGFTPNPRLVMTGSVVMALAAWAGWVFINEPKLIYFSNRLDKPRPEIWAGFLLAAIALTAFLAWQGKAQRAVRFALVGFLGGWIGFGGGGAIQGLGRIYTPELNLHWWKYMEFFFGFCFGWALSWAWQHAALPEPESAPDDAPAPWAEMLIATLWTVGLFWLYRRTPVRFPFLLAGSATLILLTRYKFGAKHVAYSVTFAGFALDLARYWSTEYKRGAPEPAYALAVAATLAFGWLVRKHSEDVAKMLELLMWSAVGFATVKFMIHPNGIVNVIDHVAIGFILMAVAVSWMLRSTVHSAKCVSVSSSSAQASTASAHSH